MSRAEIEEQIKALQAKLSAEVDEPEQPKEPAAPQPTCSGTCSVKKPKKVKRPASDAQKAAAAKNPWLKHLAEFRVAHPDLKGKAVTAAAKESYWAGKEKKQE